MLGMDDPVITFVWIGTVLSAVVCVIYGAMTWNKKGDDSE